MSAVVHALRVLHQVQGGQPVSVQGFWRLHQGQLVLQPACCCLNDYACLVVSVCVYVCVSVCLFVGLYFCIFVHLSV